MEVESSPLDYHGTRPRRLAVYDATVGPDPVGNSYFDPAGLIAFLDFSPYEGGTFIHYMSVRSDFCKQGIARDMVELLYDITEGEVDWGEIHADEAWTLYEHFRAQVRDRHHRGKKRT